jgi:hypothetical protein
MNTARESLAVTEASDSRGLIAARNPSRATTTLRSVAAEVIAAADCERADGESLKLRAAGGDRGLVTDQAEHARANALEREVSGSSSPEAAAIASGDTRSYATETRH